MAVPVLKIQGQEALRARRKRHTPPMGGKAISHIQ